VAEGQRVLHAHAVGQAIRVLHGVRLADEMREGDGQAVADRQRRVLDVPEVRPETHRAHPITRAVDRGLKLRSCRVSRARRMWKTTRRAKTPRSPAAHRQRSTRTPPRPAGKRTIHTAVPMRSAKASGICQPPRKSVVTTAPMM